MSTIQPGLPDYPLDDLRVVTGAAEVKALFDPLRSTLLELVLERAATVAELAEAVGRPRSTVAYHVNALVEVDLLRVVRTRRVRAVEERSYGRTARIFYVGQIEPEQYPDVTNYLAVAGAESVPAHEADRLRAILRYARIPREAATEFWARVFDLVNEFSQLPRRGSRCSASSRGCTPPSTRPCPTPGSRPGPTRRGGPRGVEGCARLAVARGRPSRPSGRWPVGRGSAASEGRPQGRQPSGGAVRARVGGGGADEVLDDLERLRGVEQLGCGAAATERTGRDVEVLVGQPGHVGVAAVHGEQRRPRAAGVGEPLQQVLVGVVGRHDQQGRGPAGGAEPVQPDREVRGSAVRHVVPHQRGHELGDAGPAGVLGQVGREVPGLVLLGADQQQAPVLPGRGAQARTEAGHALQQGAAGQQAAQGRCSVLVHPSRVAGRGTIAQVTSAGARTERR